MSDNNLSADPLFLGLTRPTMFMGVHYMMVVMNFMTNTLLFINKFFEYRIPAWVVGIVVIHVALYLVCLKEPRAIELFMARFGKCSKCRNRLYHKSTNSYDLN